MFDRIGKLQHSSVSADVQRVRNYNDAIVAAVIRHSVGRSAVVGSTWAAHAGLVEGWNPRAAGRNESRGPEMDENHLQ